VGDNNEALIVAIRAADMTALLPKLLKAASFIIRRQGWRGGKDTKPSSLEAQELVNESLTRIFEGAQRPQFDGDVGVAIVRAMESVAPSIRKKLRRLTLTDDLDSQPVPQDEEGDGEILEAVQQLVSSDAELTEYLLGVCYFGPKRKSIAEGLNWEPNRVSVACKRLKRLIHRTKLSTKAKVPT
jgi:hypothetical protein